MIFFQALRRGLCSTARPARGARPTTFAATFCADASAVTAVEFGLLAGVFVMLIVTVLQIGMYFYISASLDYATEKATRQIMTGSVSNQGLSAAQFRTQILCPYLPGAMSCANVITNIQTVTEGTNPGGFYPFLNASGTGVAPPTMNNSQTSFCIGTGGSYVYAQVYYAMPAFGAAWLLPNATTWNGSSVFFVGASSVFKSEPYQSSQTAGC